MRMSETFWSGLLPKSETQAMKFVTDHPLWDGRGITVGILDTGADPGAIGLTTTSDGRPKVIDIIDCSGSGDVAMGVPRSTDASAPGQLEGLTGRTLKLNPSWKNPTGQFRLGMKRAYELYPRGLVTRVKEERKKLWMETHNLAEAALQKDLLLAQSSNKPSATTEVLDVDELKTCMAQLRLLEKDHEDPGPVYDCILFHDGEMWQAVIDTSETGDVSKSTPMTDYRVSRQYAAFSELDALNYSINIFSNGDVLSIVVDAGAHGSHVAGIVSAYHPDQLELNGVAPGAQIVSLKIGDTRLGSMETGVGLIRGLIEAVKRGCHIINMSYGEAVSWDNYGEYVKQADIMVRKYGIIFVSSAGNNGPAISTVGCPGGTSSCCIGVAAMVTRSLMTAAYSMQNVVPETNFTWSSVGPTLDGDLGVSIMAPGGAVTSVPNWTRAKNQLMNGTSMSSPNATGCIALLLSAAKAEGIKVSPVSMKRIIENSALLVPNVDVLGQGHGLIQVEAAWDMMLKSKNQKWGDVGLTVRVESQRFSRGIYLRQPIESETANTFKVNIDPIFHDNITSMRRTDFELRIVLESTVPWVKCAEKMLLVEGGKTLALFIDPRDLPPGVHVASVNGYDESHMELGPRFRIPITVVRSEKIPDRCCTWHLEMESESTAASTSLPRAASTRVLSREITFLPSERIRRFIVPPKGCAFIDAVIVDRRVENQSTMSGGGASVSKAVPAVVTTNPVQDTGLEEWDKYIDSELSASVGDGNSGSAGDSSSRMICFHALQSIRGTSYCTHEKQSYFNLTPGSQHLVSWAVIEGVTLEVTLARVWSTLESPHLTLTLHFRGVTPVPARLLLTGGQRVSEIVRVHNTLGNNPVEVMPSAKLDKWVTIVKPNCVGKVMPLGERDVLFDGTALYQMVLEYDIEQTDAGEITPKWPGLQGSLYESHFQSQFFMVFDGKKKLIGSGDCFPKGIKTQKGKHTVRIQIKHASIAVLESVNDLPMQLQRSIKSAIALTFFLTHSDTLVGTDKLSVRAVAPGGSTSFHFKEPTQDQIPKGALPGDTLFGTVTYLKKENTSIGCGTKPGGYEVKYIVGDTKIAATSTSTPAATSTSTLVSADIEVVSTDIVSTPSPVTAPSDGTVLLNDKTDQENTTPPSNSPVLANKEKDNAQEKESGIDVAVREAKTKYLKNLVGLPSTFDSLYSTMETEYPTDLPLKLVGLSHSVKCKSNALAASLKTDAKDLAAAAILSIKAVYHSADRVVSLIDQDAVARDLGVNIDRDDSAAVTNRKDAESKKAALSDAYSAAAMAKLDEIKCYTKQLCHIEKSSIVSDDIASQSESSTNLDVDVPTKTEPTTESSDLQSDSTFQPIAQSAVAFTFGSSEMTTSQLTVLADAAKKEFENVYKKLLRWDDVNADKHWALCVGRFKLKSQWGMALKKINELAAASADNKTKGEVVSRDVLYEERIIILTELKWTHALQDAKSWLILSSKSSYDLF